MSKKTKPPGNISAGGLITIEDTDRLDKIPVYYFADRGRWYAPKKPSGFGPFTTGQISTMLAEYGINRFIKDGNGNTDADRADVWLTQNHHVDYAGPLAGYKEGVHSVKGGRILVTKSPSIVQPKRGKWDTIALLIETLLDDNAHYQADVFYTWAAVSLRGLIERFTTPGPWRFRHCPALGMSGPKGCGKSAIIELVLEPLFGVKADPFTFLQEAKFNKDLIGSVLLVLDDKGAVSTLSERRLRGERIKDLLWKPDQRMEGKGMDALTLQPYWRLIFACNNTDAGMQTYPAIDASMDDKLIILKAAMAEGLPQNDDENREWTAKIARELPAFADFLIHYKTPKNLTLDPRTGVVNFQHPDLVSCLREMQPEMKLLELIDAFNIVGDDAPLWEGTFTEFESIMRTKDEHGLLERVFTNQVSAGKLLSELSRCVPNRVVKTNRANSSFYRIFHKNTKPVSKPQA